MAHLVCIMTREKRDIICSSKVVAHLVDLPIAFPFPPLGSTVLEPDLTNTKNRAEEEIFQKTTRLVQAANSPLFVVIE